MSTMNAIKQYCFDSTEIGTSANSVGLTATMLGACDAASAVRIGPLKFPLLNRWRFYLQELGDGHWISVSRGPPEDIVDAWGDFLDSLDRPNPPHKLLQVTHLTSA